MPGKFPELRLEDYECFLFDLDGTLIDGSDRHFVNCVFETGKEFGHENLVIPPGAPLRQFLRKAWEGKDEDFIDRFYIRNRERMISTPRPVRFHDDTIRFIQTYPSFPRALVTNCHDWEMELTQREVNLNEVFDVIVYKTPGVPGKPAPDLYFKAAEHFRLPPGKCLVFEDSSTGIKAGKNAGMTVIGIDRGTHQDFEEADFVITSFLELIHEREKVKGKR